MNALKFLVVAGGVWVIYHLLMPSSDVSPVAVSKVRRRVGQARRTRQLVNGLAAARHKHKAGRGVAH